MKKSAIHKANFLSNFTPLPLPVSRETVLFSSAAGHQTLDAHQTEHTHTPDHFYASNYYYYYNSENND